MSRIRWNRKAAFINRKVRNMSLVKNIITLQAGGRPSNEIKAFHIDKSRFELTLKNIRGLFDNFTGLVQLHLTGVSLRSLEFFAYLPELKNLDLHNNCLSQGLENLLVCPKLREINLSKNYFTTCESFWPLNSLKNLRKLWIIKNPIDLPREVYLVNIFLMIQPLLVLDGFSRHNCIDTNVKKIKDVDASEFTVTTDSDDCTHIQIKHKNDNDAHGISSDNPELGLLINENGQENDDQDTFFYATGYLDSDDSSDDDDETPREPPYRRLYI